MARSYGRVFATIWDDEDFQALSPMAQRMYLFLLSQSDLEHSGVIPLRERRWAHACGALSTSQVTDDLKELESAQFVVTDEDAEELLVRSLIRRDEVWKQPNVFKSALSSATAAKSQRVRVTLAAELRRLDLNGDLARLREITVADLEPPANPSRTLREPPLDPPGWGVETPPGGSNDLLPDVVSENKETAGQNPSGTLNEPLAKGGEEATGKGEGYGDVPRGAFPLSPFPFPFPPPAGGASALTPQTLLASFIDWDRGNGGTLTKRTIGQIAKTIGDLLDQGVGDRHIRRGLADWRASGQNPSTLDSFVNAAMKGAHDSRNRGSPLGAESTGAQRAQQAREAGQRVQALIDEGEHP